MKHRRLWLLPALALALQATGALAATTPPPELKPVPLEAKAAHVAAQVLSRFHYKAMPLDEALSVNIARLPLSDLHKATEAIALTLAEVLGA